MRGRFLIGAVAVFGATSWAGEASAAQQCSDFRNLARQSSDLQETRTLRTQANGCSPSVIADIDREIARLENSAPKPEEAAAVVTPTAQIAASVPARAAPVRSLTLGQTVTGALSATSAVDAERGVANEDWSFHAPAGQRVQVSMTATGSTQLDTYLVVGRMRDGQFETLAVNDDRGDGTFNSQLRFTPDEAGEYMVRAGSFAPGQYGAYALTVEASVASTEAVPRPLEIGEVHTAALSPESAVDAGQGYAFDVWTFQASAGQLLQVSMTSREFDTYLEVGRAQGGTFSEAASNDDRGDGTLNSMLRFTADEAGEYTIRARSFAEEQFGEYELLVQPAATPVAARIPLERNQNAWVLQGDLDSESGGDHADFEFQPTRGRRYSVRVMSDEFSPIVDVGLLDGARLSAVNFYGPESERQANAAEFSADARGRYILRVNAPALTGGRFDLIVTELP
jgi:hypothetical protein